MLARFALHLAQDLFILARALFTFGLPGLHLARSLSTFGLHVLHVAWVLSTFG